MPVQPPLQSASPRSEPVAPKARPGLAVVTIIASNYLGFARTLARSLSRHHPDLRLHVVLVDKVDGRFDPLEEPFTLLTLEQVSMPELPRFLFSHTRKEAATGVKPQVMRHLLTSGFEQALFIDPDTFVLGPLDALFDAVAKHAVTLTPHLLTPLTGADRIERELNILLSGTFNAGVVGLSATEEALRALDWWQARVREHCAWAVGDGLFYEQRWLDLMPAFFEDIGIFRDPAYNVAHWNLPERADVDVRLMHFSGFDPEDRNAVTYHSPRLSMKDVAKLTPWFDVFRRELVVSRHSEAQRFAYAFDQFDNGAQISAEARKRYRELGDDAQRFGDPFVTGSSQSFYRWLELGA